MKTWCVANAHGTEYHPPKMKHAKGELFARPPSPLAGGYQSARSARPLPETSNTVFHVKRSGFTLIEVLVALAITSIALLASLRVAGGGTHSVGELRARLLAGWVAENVLAEQRARGVWLPPGMQRGLVRQGGIDFAWREEVVATPNSLFRRVDVRVFAAQDETHDLAHLVGFAVHPPGGGK